MNIKMAYEKVKKLQNQKILIGCIDTEDQWLFLFYKRELGPGESLLGACYDAVNKKTGEISQIPAIPQNMVKIIAKKGKEVNVKQFK